MEGVADRRGASDIAVDNIQIMDGLRAEDCKGAYCRSRGRTRVLHAGSVSNAAAVL